MQNQQNPPPHSQQFVTVQPGQRAPVQYAPQGAPPGAQVVSMHGQPHHQQQHHHHQQHQAPPPPPPPMHQQQHSQYQQQGPGQGQGGGPPPAHSPQPRSTDSPAQIAGEDPRNLIVNYIPTPVTDNELRQLFEQYGELDSARVICDRITSHPKGYGFVKYKDDAGARAAMENMNGFEIYNKRLKVTTAKGPHCAAINNHTQRLQHVVSSTPPTMMVQQSSGQPLHQQHNQQVQYVLVDSNMQPLQQAGGRQFNGAVGVPREHQLPSHHQHHQGSSSGGGGNSSKSNNNSNNNNGNPPVQMFQVPNAVALGPGNDPYSHDSCNFSHLSQYNSFNSSSHGHGNQQQQGQQQPPHHGGRGSPSQ